MLNERSSSTPRLQNTEMAFKSNFNSHAAEYSCVQNQLINGTSNNFMHGVIFQLDQTEENCFCFVNDEGLMQHRGNNLFLT